MTRKDNVAIAEANQSLLDENVPYAFEFRIPFGMPQYMWDVEVEIHTAVTQESVIDLWNRGFEKIAVLNFASARNPGGGYLTGANAQEESLCRAIPNLYPSLIPELYPMKSPYVLVSEDLKMMRDENNEMLETPIPVKVISAAAPNMKHTHVNREQTNYELEQRIQITADTVVAAADGCDALVLGAWGCGVFKNDPYVIAKALQGAVKRYGSQGLVVYAVPDTMLQKAFNWAVYRR